MAIDLNPDELNDYEFMTPAQAAEARKMQAELPLWQPVQDAPAAPPVQTDVAAPAGAPSAYNPDYGKWLADVELHRVINDTTGQESEV
jgi:hypothetical protein